ncbi:MAG TPA: type II toxin-antitoxin system Phd/YefM family antitoxin [Chloroflexota bacterium]|nr:type II toxin-antitoxin system Phd/YefM family antitoxin [Chloroflexota bacterium]
METKTIASTEAQNNFGRILNDVLQNRTRYVIQRHNEAQAIILSLSDFEQILADQAEQNKMSHLVRELAPAYHLGTAVGSATDNGAS